MAGLSRGPPEDLEIFSEYLDLTRFPAAQYGDDLVRYLSARYATRKPDVVIAVGSSALELARCPPRRALCRRADCLCECGPS